ncbi:AMP-dependent synthetase/ligase [Quillaja saponaria]|uniref:AMP-dependent synthetase/ligase n=1 Tax=Quillaja saponaria TaxID=32244 RepID=A0AAD7LGW2_QUISA|nr:AMP-dependent synthetase/ligase [Quillaja saponaria]
MDGMIPCSANYCPLSPISFLERSAIIYRDGLSIVYGNVRYTWRQRLERCTKLACAIAQLGVSRGNVFLDIAEGAINILSKTGVNIPLLVLIPECNQPSFNTSYNIASSGHLEYENLLAKGRLDFEVRKPRDEWDPISLNYTSGTTSSPKGVVYSHRGAYLNSLAAVLLNEMSSVPVYLWCVPMFHCNGWCLTWGIAAQGGTNVCQRNLTANETFDNISQHKVTYMGGAPTVLSMIINAPAGDRSPLPGKVAVMTGGAPPPPQVLFEMEKLGFVVTHSYGLTETYGPGTVCSWKPEWNSLSQDAQAKMKSRQGVHHLGLEAIDIKDPFTMKSVPPDTKTIGEVMFIGNTVMNGYLKDSKAIQEAFNGGWFRSGDLGVKHPDGYIELKDRSKDIIISGGENISTIEVEAVLFSHPAVLDAAFVGRPDDHWGETPCAFVKLKEGYSVKMEEIIHFCRNRLPHYMAPRTVVFEDLPKTSTGKTQKFVLREKAKSMGSLSKNTSRL